MRKEDRVALFLAEQYVTKNYKITSVELHAQRRTQDVVHARFIVWCILRYSYQWSTPKIADVFGKDHSTVVDGLKRAEKIGLKKEALDGYSKP
jgi:chromosomal replication initiation ATPase DnaA